MTRSFLRIVAAALVAAATCVGPASPAAAAPCGSAAGVSVVVDYGALGGGVATACDAGSGQVAATRFEQAGFALTYVQRQPGFVCRVDGVPAADPCVNTPPADAYWGLFWSDGRSGTWTYATLGAAWLEVPDGGAVALAWQQGAARRTPAVAAPVHPAPTPSSSPTRSPSTSPTPQPAPQPAPSPTKQPTASTPAPPPTPQAPTESSGPVAPTAGPSPSAASAGRSPRPPRTPPSTEAAPRPTPQATDAPAPDPGAAAAAQDTSGLPVWVTPVVLVLLGVSIAVSSLAARRRRRPDTGP